MNYRHAFHAGNFADVVKHAILVRILVHLRAKPTPFRVIDTHAGAGLYDLDSSEASRSGEWHEGIARLMGAPIAEEAEALLAPYLAAISALNQPGGLIVYPGSPMLARAFLRQRDRLVACELEPSAAAALAANLRKDRRCKAIAIDGWTALNAYIPPKERRGLVLVDPSFEDTADFRRLEHALDAAHRKWATGIYLLWYPIKDRRCADILAHGLRRSGIANSLRAKILRAKILRAEIDLAGTRDRLRACGLIVVNPPWRLESELRVLLPALVAALTKDNGGAHRLDWLNGEK
jgi:23S rRNA (adenine2030-N6)-methyltransferase